MSETPKSESSKDPFEDLHSSLPELSRLLIETQAKLTQIDDLIGDIDDFEDIPSSDVVSYEELLSDQLAERVNAQRNIMSRKIAAVLAATPESERKAVSGEIDNILKSNGLDVFARADIMLKAEEENIPKE